MQIHRGAGQQQQRKDSQPGEPGQTLWRPERRFTNQRRLNREKLQFAVLRYERGDANDHRRQHSGDQEPRFGEEDRPQQAQGGGNRDPKPVGPERAAASFARTESLRHRYAEE
jgi:hypothetical protein